jgi:catechol 2,3-dioxygenase-like lactoylglutathione lyase family enzyme
MVTGGTLVAFIATADAERSHAFYEGVLALTRVDATPFANVYAGGGTPLRVTVVPGVKPRPYTVLGWEVPDISTAIATLTERGVEFKRYTAFAQDEMGVWTTPEGARVAWFQDPDGNLLSLTEPASRGARP